MKKEIDSEKTCAFDEDRRCSDSCVAYGKKEKGCAGYHAYCKRGGFWIGEF